MDQAAVLSSRVEVCATDWVEAFAGFLRGEGMAEKTLRAYLQDCRAFAVWYEGANGEPFAPGALTSTDLRTFRAEAVQRKAAPATFNRQRATLKRLASWAIGTGLLQYDPFRGVERVEENEQAPRWMTQQEAHRLVRAMELQIAGARTEAGKAQAIRDRAMVGMMLYAGLRVAEVCALDLSDIVLTARKGKVTVWGKGSKRREVPLGAELREILRAYLSYRGEQAGPLFDGKRQGLRMGTRGVEHRLEALRGLAGLGPEVTPHALRHTFAKRLVDKGMQLPLVQKLMGHARLETTARYTRPGWEDLEAAVE